jgi:hypothetical protein
VAQIGEGHEAQGLAPQVLTFDTPSIGEILADRYQIEAHLGDDALGRQMFRGSDVVLRRPVTVVLRQPGGDAASEMLAAAVAASRVVHPHLVGVYDAIDEGDRAYVVREWIDGVSLREAIAEGPVDIARAVAIAWAVADAVAALHATEVVHGNVHPGTVMIAQDGRVMLADARADDAATVEADIRAIGGILYCALTGFWPHKEVGSAQVPDGIHENGQLVAPGQVRDDVPAAVDDFTMSLLDLDTDPPGAEAVVAELAVLSEAVDTHEEGSLGFAAFDAAAAAPGAAGPRQGGRRIAMGIGALLALALVGTIAATQFGGGSSGTGQGGKTGASPSVSGAAAGPRALHIPADKVRVIDPAGNGTELENAALVVDGDHQKGWTTEDYPRPKFGDMKPGMGILIDFGSPQQVETVQVELDPAGATIELRAGDVDPGNGTHSPAGDQQVVDQLARVGDEKVEAGVRAVFPGKDNPVRYILVWVTKLPPSSGQFTIKINEISVTVR